MMDNEMAGIAMPPAEEGMDTAEENLQQDVQDISVDNMVANYEAMEEDKKTLAQVFAAPEISSYIDEILGKPLMTEFVAAANVQPMQPDAPVSSPIPESSTAGMMAPTAEPMADMPMEDEEATPPV